MSTIELLRKAVQTKQAYWDANLALEKRLAAEQKIEDLPDGICDELHDAIETLAAGGDAGQCDESELAWVREKCGLSLA